MAILALDIAVVRDGFTLQVNERLVLDGITALFGPSGSGKTTLLRVIAGLERDAEGRVALDDVVWQGDGFRVPAHARRVGVVFQDGRLFPHLTVEGNLRFAAKRAAVHTIGVDEVVAALDLAPLLARRPISLSGGEKQRVALGRALVGNPRLLLMDEPLSSLDVARKREILPHIERLPAAFGVPVLYVTHDLDEVARLATSVLLLGAGRVTGVGSVTDVMQRLELGALAGTRETGAVLVARVAGRDGALAALDLGRQTIAVPLPGVAQGTAVRVRVHASDVAIATVRPRRISIRNILEATILRIDAAEDGDVDVLLAVDEQQLRARITRGAAVELELAVGQAVFALVKGVALEHGLIG